MPAAEGDDRLRGTREQLEDLHAKVLATSPVGHTIGNAVPVEISLA